MTVLLILLLLTCSSAQLAREELPSELRHLLDGDLDTWEPPKEYLTKFPYYLSGFDDEGRPVWVTEFGKWDVKTEVEKGPEYDERLNKYCSQWLYRVINSTGIKATPERPVKEGIDIHDWENFSLTQLNSVKSVAFNIRQSRQLALAMKFLSAGYMINMNFVAEQLLNLLKPALGTEFYRLEIYGTNKEKWLPQLKRKIPKNQLPEWYGGIKDFAPYKVYG